MSTTLQDMRLLVNVAVTGTVGANNTLDITATYSMLACVPPMPSGGAPVVESNGNIDLRCMSAGAGFTNGTDIYFVLSGTVTDANGNTYPVFFNHPASKAVT